MKYKVAVIDDIEDNINVFKEIQKHYKKQFEIELVHILKSEDLKLLYEYPFDIVFFDYNLKGKFRDEDDNGFNVLKRFREKNTHAKVILFSSEFPNIDADEFKSSDMRELEKITHIDFVEIINDLNIFKIIKRNFKLLRATMCEAITSLDLLLVALENVKLDVKDSGLEYNIAVNGNMVSIEDLITAIKMDSEIGQSFKDEFYEILISSLMEYRVHE